MLGETNAIPEEAWLEKSMDADTLFVFRADQELRVNPRPMDEVVAELREREISEEIIESIVKGDADVIIDRDTGRRMKAREYSVVLLKAILSTPWDLDVEESQA